MTLFLGRFLCHDPWEVASAVVAWEPLGDLVLRDWMRHANLEYLFLGLKVLRMLQSVTLSIHLAWALDDFLHPYALERYVNVLACHEHGHGHHDSEGKVLHVQKQERIGLWCRALQRARV